jgi:hypothetical protein
MLAEPKKALAWTRIWELTQRNAGGKWRFYTGLTQKERETLLSSFYDFLDYGRKIEMGSDYPPEATASPAPRPHNAALTEARPTEAGLHDRANYSFGEKRLWIPWAQNMAGGTERGSYPNGYPRGLVVHFTAGHRNGIAAGNEVMRNTGCLYLLLDKDGNLGQGNSLRRHGYHAGVSSHKGAVGTVSDEYAGVEVMCWGGVSKSGAGFRSWAGTTVAASEVVHQAAKRGNIAPGHYQVYTRKQMFALRRLVCWLHLNCPEEFRLDRVVGHDEVSPGRKNDPGASLYDHERGCPLTMEEFRQLLAQDVGQILARK